MVVESGEDKTEVMEDAGRKTESKFMKMEVSKRIVEKSTVVVVVVDF